METQTPTVNVWKMNKIQLVEEAMRRGLAVSTKWSALEIRSIIQEH